MDRKVVLAQILFEMLVFEGGKRFEAAGLRVDCRRQGHGGARELPVLCFALGLGVGEKVLMSQAALLRVPAPDAFRQRAIVGQLDAPPDGPCSIRDGPELGGEPVRRHHRVGIRARYEALGAAHLEKAGACSIHPDPAGGARSLARTIGGRTLRVRSALALVGSPRRCRGRELRRASPLWRTTL